MRISLFSLLCSFHLFGSMLVSIGGDAPAAPKRPPVLRLPKEDLTPYLFLPDQCRTRKECRHRDALESVQHQALPREEKIGNGCA